MQETLDKLAKIQDLVNQAIELSRELQVSLEEEINKVDKIVQNDFYIMSEDGNMMTKIDGNSLMAESLRGNSSSLFFLDIGYTLEEDFIAIQKEIERNIDLI